MIERNIQTEADLHFHSPLPLAGEGLGERVCVQRNIGCSGTTLSLTLVEQLAIRLGWQTTPAKSLVISRQRERGLTPGLNND